MKVRLGRVGALAILTLDSPPANALDDRVIAGLERGLDEIETSEARCVLVRSAVPGCFAAGADLKLMAAVDQEGFRAYLGRLRRPIERLAALGIPSIAAIDGHALGGGLELALACTIRVAGPGARLGVPEIRLGLIPGAGATQRLPLAIGRGRTLELILSGRALGSEEALAAGLVDRSAAQAEASALAERIAAHPQSALRAAMRAVGADRLRPGLARELTEVVALFGGDDAREGVAAFLEKRPPRFEPANTD